MENAPQIKRDEQYPLLKVEGGGGDGNKRSQVSTTVITSGWNVSCVPKRSWCDRWPEYISACWMTLILMAISFLVFYALGMNAYRRQPFVVMRCNDSKPSSNVYYHHIIARGSYVPFRLYSEYLSFMALQYPSLHFHVYFLMDDSLPNKLEASKHSKFFTRLVPQISSTFTLMLDQNYKREIWDFQRRYQNVNISVMYLSKYMSKTPFKYKWKTVPQTYLTFYAMIYEIWQNGGIGFDLIAFNNRFNNIKRIDHRVSAILKQHNEGIDQKKYAQILDMLDNEEEHQIFSMFFNVINNILNETCFFFNNDFTPDVKVLEDSPVIRTHRTKRELSKTEITNNVENFATNLTEINKSITKVDTNDTKYPISNKTDLIKNTEGISSTKNIIKKNYTDKTALNFNKTYGIQNLNNTKNNIEIWNDTPQVLLFYDFSGFVDDMGPSYLSPKLTLKSESSQNVQGRRPILHTNKKLYSNYLTISPDGTFVAASSRHHPFLLQFFSVGNLKLNPMLAIKDLLWTQCSGLFLNDYYCDSIRLLYNIV